MLNRLLALALLMSPGVAAADDLHLVDGGKLSWATAPTFIPYEYLKDGKPIGFDVDMVEELARRLGLAAAITPLEFKGVMPALLGKRVDVAVSGLYMTDERLAAVGMVPYALIGNQIVVKKGNPKHLSGPDSLCGTRVAASIATSYEASVRTRSAAWVAAGKAAIELLSVPGSNLVALAILQERVDAGIISNAAVIAMMAENPDTVEPAGEPYDTTTRLGIAFNKDNPMLGTALQTALDDMAKDGAYAKMLAKWNLSSSTIY